MRAESVGILCIALLGTIAALLAFHVQPFLGAGLATLALLPLGLALGALATRHYLLCFAFIFPQYLLFEVVTGLWSTRFAEILAIAVMSVIGLRVVTTDFRLTTLPPRYSIWCALFGCWVFFTVVMSVDTGTSLIAAGNQIYLLAGLLLFNHALTDERMLLRFFDWLLWGICFYSCIVLLLFAIGIAGGGALIAVLAGKGALFGINTNALPVPAFAGLPLVLARAMDADRYRWFYAAMVAVIGGVIILSVSRSAWLAGMAGVAACLVIREIAVGRGRRLVGWSLAAGAFVSVVLIINWETVSILVGADRGTTGRTFLWRAALDMIHDFPITGIGPGMWPVMDALYAAPDGPLEVTHFATHAHNLLLMEMAEMGIPAGVLVLALIGMLCRDSIRGALATTSSLSGEMRTLLIGSVGVLAAGIARSVFESDFFVSSGIPSRTYWMVFVAVVAIRGMSASQQIVTAPERPPQAAGT